MSEKTEEKIVPEVEKSPEQQRADFEARREAIVAQAMALIDAVDEDRRAGFSAYLRDGVGEALKQIGTDLGILLLTGGASNARLARGVDESKRIGEVLWTLLTKRSHDEAKASVDRDYKKGLY